MYKPSQPCLTLSPKSSILVTPNENIHFFSSDRFLSVLPSPNYTLQHVSLPSCKLLFHPYCYPVTNLPNHATTPGRWHPQQTLQLSAGRAGNLNTSTPKHKYCICLIISWISVWRCGKQKSSIPRIHFPYLASFTRIVRNQAKRSRQAGYQLKKSGFPHSAMSMFIMKRQCTCTLHQNGIFYKQRLSYNRKIQKG